MFLYNYILILWQNRNSPLLPSYNNLTIVIYQREQFKFSIIKLLTLLLGALVSLYKKPVQISF